MSEEMTFLKRRSRDRSDKERHDLEQQVISLTKQLEIIRAENASLLKQMEMTSVDLSRSSTDRGHMANTYKLEVQSLKSEVSMMRTLLEESERNLREELEMHRETSSSVARLTEVKTLLQQRLEGGGTNTVAEKQLKSVERRLQITEERLTQERSDRASKLCEVEEKLLSNNARLQVSEKELKRQLLREKERLKNMETKYRDMRNENEKLQSQLMEQPPLVTDLLKTHRKPHSAMNGNTSDVVNDIWNYLKHQEGLEDGQEQEAILLLWQQRQAAHALLREWEQQFESIGIDGDMSASLKVVREQQQDVERKLRLMKDETDDTKKERDQTEMMLKSQIKDLLTEKHSAVARLRSLEDINAGLLGENDSLRNTLKVVSAAQNKTSDSTVSQAQVKSLESELSSCRLELTQSSRRCSQLEAEGDSLKSQLRAREQELADSKQELELRPSSTNKGLEEAQKIKLDHLAGELKGAYAEVKLWKEKHSNLQRECGELEEKLALTSKKLTRAKISSTDNLLDASCPESEKLALENELHEKDAQLVKLTVQYNEAENELQRNKQLLLLQQQHNEDLTAQLDQLQNQLRQKSRQLEKMSMAESESRVEKHALQENLTQSNKDLALKSNELKARLVEIERERQRISTLEDQLRKRDTLLTQSVVDAVHDGRIKTVVWGSGGEGETSLVGVDNMLRQLRTETELRSHDLQKAHLCIESLTSENADLLTQLHLIRQDLVKERTQVCQLTSDKMDADHKLHAVMEERDWQDKEKTRLEYDLAKQESHTLHVLESLETQSQKVSLEYKDKYRSLDQEGKQLVIDLSTTRQLLEAREKENGLLRDTIERQRLCSQDMARRLEGATEEHQGAEEERRKMMETMSSQMRETAELQATIQVLRSEMRKLEEKTKRLEGSIKEEQSSGEQSTTHIQQLHSKLSQHTDTLRETQDDLNTKAGKLVSMESKLKETEDRWRRSELERKSLREELDQIKEEQKELRRSRGVLEEQLSKEKYTVENGQMSNRRLTEQLLQCQKQLEAMTEEYERLETRLEAEQSSGQTLRCQQQSQNEQVYSLESKLRSQDTNREAVQTLLTELKKALEVCQDEKHSLLLDNKEFSARVLEKEAVIKELEAKCSSQEQKIHVDYASAKVRLIEENHQKTAEIQQLREERDCLKEQLHQKALNLETQNQTNAMQVSDARIEEMERLVSQLQTRINDKTVLESTRSDVQRMMTDLMHCLQEHTTAQKNIVLRDKHAETEVVRAQVMSIESALSQEKALHVITRQQLSSTEEDNRRLRQQLQVARKRITCTPDADRSKSRMEEINEIIARSQTRAAQLLASGVYGDDPWRTLSPSQDFTSTPPSFLSHGSTAPLPLSSEDLSSPVPVKDLPDRVFLTEHT